MKFLSCEVSLLTIWWQSFLCDWDWGQQKPKGGHTLYMYIVYTIVVRNYFIGQQKNCTKRFWQVYFKKVISVNYINKIIFLTIAFVFK